ncbi:hypothetical protein G6L94_11870 [Agrobacterium rhizogenes]|nr:hypothetical protein [Rhizobium rhizogenes]NTI94386.1 hypothetical protein [Rhizobium rhizogenes]NTJ56853.1 hypothetical protein [Rhizobium rhizogenes]
MVATTEANAWIMAAIAVASVVASMVAAHNQTDGGVGAMLSANLELTKIAIAKLNDIETRLTDIYQQLQALPDQIDSLLKQETTRTLHIEMLSVVRGYNEKLQNRDPSIPADVWKKDRLTQVDAAKLLARLEAARQKVNVQNLLDPSTALIASSIAFVEVNLKNILGYRSYEIIGTIDNVYLPWIDAILDEKQSQSAAAYTKGARTRLDDCVAKASKNQVGQSLSMTPGATALLACTGVKDYLASQTHIERECDYPTSAPLGQEHPLLWRIADRREARMMCHYDKWTTPGHDGVDERLFLTTFLQEEEVVVDGQKTGLMALILSKTDEIRANAGAQGNPPNDKCEHAQFDMADPNARLQTMKGMATRVAADKAYEELAKLVDQINMERSRIAYGAQTMVACQVTRDNLGQLKRIYS